jgi:hypothetical protein
MTAQIDQSVSIIAPGIWGLNRQDAIDQMDLRFALDAQNSVQDTTGRLTVRKGYTAVTTATIGGGANIQQIFEYVDKTGATSFLSAANLNIYSGSTTLTSVYSTAITANNWQAVNFNNFMWFFQRSHVPLRWNGATMVTIASLGGTGTPPSANAVLGAFGRLYAIDTVTDKTTLYFSDTLIGQNWTGGTAGTLDLSTVWQNGMDTGVALASFNNYLVIFGRKSILLYSGAATPANLSLVEVIKGIGCIARDSVQNIGTDIYFLSDTGVRSLARTIQTTTVPITDISKNVRDFMLTYVVSEANLELVRSVYSEQEGFYLLSFPGNGITFCFNIRQNLQDGTNPATYWLTINPKAMLASRDRSLYFGHAGIITKYNGYADLGSSIDWSHLSPWTDFQSPQQQKILKKLLTVLAGANNQTVTTKWFWDYSTTGFSSQQIIGLMGQAEYGTAQYGIDEYSSGIGLSQVSASGQGTGKVLQVGTSASVNGTQLGLHKYDAYAKQGKMI